MQHACSTSRLRRFATLVTAVATTAAGALLAGAPPASATTSYTYTVTPVIVGTTPYAIAIDSATDTIYIANSGSNTVSVIDGATREVTATVNVGPNPAAVAVNPTTNRIYTANINNNTVSVIDGTKNTVVATVNVGGGTPKALAVNPTTNKIYVPNPNDNTVSIIDGATLDVTSVNVGTMPYAVAVDTGTDMIYVPNQNSNSVSVIDGTTNAVAKTVYVGGSPDSVAIDPVTHNVYVANIDEGSVSVIDGTKNIVMATVPVGAVPSAMAVDSTSHTVYVDNVNSSTVSVIDAATNTAKRVAVGSEPKGVAVDQDTHTVYVANFNASTVSVIDGTVPVIDGTTNAVTDTLAVGTNPYTLAVDPATHDVYVVNYSNSSVSVISQAVVTTTTLSSSSSPTAGAPVTLRATISPNPGGGSVAFDDGGTPIVGCATQPVNTTTGKATCAVTFPSSGAHMIGASYTGKAGYAGSTATPLALTVAPAPAPVVTPPAASVSRVAGPDRYATAVAASKLQFPAGGAGAVMLATGANYPDALVGVPLAAAKNAPLLLTTGTTLPTCTKDEIVRVLPAGRTVYVLGSTNAVPASVTAQLTSLGYTVDRLAGADRYATAIKVADALGDPTTALLASGHGYADALAAGPAGAKTGGVVLLTAGTSLPTATSAYLAAHSGAVYAVGGPAAAADRAATPLAGADRYGTAATVATRFFPAPAHVGVATGANYPDALSGGALVAASGGPLLLADTGHTDATTSYLSQVRVGVSTCWMFGDTNAIPTTVVDTITTALGR